MQAAGKFGHDQATHAFEDFVNIDVTHDMGPAMWRQQTIDQRLQAIGFFDDDLGVLT